MGASKRKSSKKAGASILGAFREKDKFNPMLAADGGHAKKPKKMMRGGPAKKSGGMPDLSGDGKVTQKDVLIGRGVIKRMGGGPAKKSGVMKKAMGGVAKKSGVMKKMRGGPMKKAMGGVAKKSGVMKKMRGGPIKKK